MSVKYEFYPNPAAEGNPGEPRYHVRTVTEGTVDTPWLARKIQSRCTASSADVKAVLEALQEVVVEELTEGRRVHIDGLGYLSMTLACPSVEPGRAIRAESIRFKSVSFRAEAGLKEKLAAARFERADRKHHSTSFTPAETDDLLAGYFATHPTLSRQNFQHLCGCLKTTANRRLKTLVKEGKLRNIGLRQFPLYEPRPGYYGKPEGGETENT